MSTSKIVYVADFFFPETLGGAEQSDHELLNIVQNLGINIIKLRSNDVLVSDVYNYKCLWIISNFVNLGRAPKEELAERGQYIIVEHDHKYLASRDPSFYSNYTAPKPELKNVEFYQGAKYVMVQSNLHCDIIHKNLADIKTFTVGGNLWSEDLLDKLESLPAPPANDICSIMVSNIQHKNTKGAIEFCQKTNRDYELISQTSAEVFFERIAKNEYFLFLPQAVETLSRIVVEAKMIGCKVITNNRIGAASESWFSDLSGQDLIDYMRNDKKEEIRDFIRGLL